MVLSSTALENMHAIDAAWNGRQWERYASFLADDLEVQTAGEASSHGKRDHVEKARALCAACPDAVVHSDPYIEFFTNAEGDKSCSVARITGTLSGLPFETSFASICTWRDGQIVHQLQFIDTETAKRQVGAGEQAAEP
ncbi:ester cyclase [Sphingopyxis sp. PET50]|uniref:ester cyclase n=1 Tax=Sphingopyxis sp. PET50 TaxID=2976533 RepID=UPI0021AF4F32|nr:ester cyclase [Sphingopyxis sp. PET50]